MTGKNASYTVFSLDQNSSESGSKLFCLGHHLPGWNGWEGSSVSGVLRPLLLVLLPLLEADDEYVDPKVAVVVVLVGGDGEDVEMVERAVE